jgi:hypothetical protein
MLGRPRLWPDADRDWSPIALAECALLGISNTPVEVLERQHPVRIEDYALIPDSGGAGRFRGGLACGDRIVCSPMKPCCSCAPIV